MPYDPNRHHRRSIRLPGYDYATPGTYFITICVQHRACILGVVESGVVYPSAAGTMARAIWCSLPERFPCVALDAFVVMPNHVHGLIMIAESPAPCAPLSAVVGAWKSLTTRAYIRGVHEDGWPCFDTRLWQRNYWEHVVRDDAELERLRHYVCTNPIRWYADQLNPSATLSNP